MESKPRNLGRAYLVAELRRRHGLSRRRARPILDFIFAEMSAALARDEPVEFPFGYLERREKTSPRFESMLVDEPMQPYKVEHVLDGEGDWLLNPEDWDCRPAKTRLPPYIKPRRPRGRPRKAPAATAR
jgi:hypothetical protein